MLFLVVCLASAVLYDTSFGHIRSLVRYLLTNRDTKKKNEEELANATQNLTRAALRIAARVIRVNKIKKNE